MKELFPIFVVLAASHAAALAVGTYHVSPDGSHEPPFGSPATAATNLQAAVDLAGPGDTVLVGPGHYLLDAEVSVSRAMLLSGIDGPAATIIDGGGLVRGFNLADVDCVVAGLTVTNGYADGSGGGIYCAGPLPVVTNCVVAGNRAKYGGGMFNGTAYRSVFTHNTATEYGGGLAEAGAHGCSFVGNTADFGGGAAFASLWDCIAEGNHATLESGGLDGCYAYNTLLRNNTSVGVGGGAGWSELYNCTVVGNASQDFGGGVYYSVVYNCIVHFNSSPLGYQDIYDPSEIANTCSPDALHGVEGNITNAPLFADPASGNYRLQAGSPCIDAGDNALVVGAVDLDGNDRIVGGTVDMGAYEFPLAAFAVTGGWTPGGFVVQWPSEAGRKYAVRRSHGLPGGFEVLADGIGHPQNSYTDAVHAAASAVFYRVDVRLE